MVPLWRFRSNNVIDVLADLLIEHGLRDELLNGEIFCSLEEVRIVIGWWRDHYNRARPHSSLGYRPPAPIRMSAWALGSAALCLSPNKHSKCGSANYANGPVIADSPPESGDYTF